MFISDGANIYEGAQPFSDQRPEGTMRDRMFDSMLYEQARLQRQSEAQASADRSQFVSEVVAELNSNLDLSGRLSAMETNLNSAITYMETEVEYFGGVVEDMRSFLNEQDLTIPDESVTEQNPATHRYIKRPIN